MTIVCRMNTHFHIPIFKADIEMLATNVALVIVGVVMHFIHVVIAHSRGGKLLPAGFAFILALSMDVLHVVAQAGTVGELPSAEFTYDLAWGFVIKMTFVSSVRYFVI